MCEANVYINRNGHEELYMEKVDRIIPGEDGNLFLESIFGERRVIKASIREMELVHHRIVIVETKDEQQEAKDQEIWLEPNTGHGHFHPGEEVNLQLFKGYNMHPAGEPDLSDLQAFVVSAGTAEPVAIHDHHGNAEISLGKDVVDGLVQLYVQTDGDRPLYTTILVEVGHHSHHTVEPVGIPLEIIPCSYGHAHLGESYAIRVLKNGQPLIGAEVKATYTGTHNRDYPHKLTTNEEGEASLYLTARGNYLFSVQDGGITSTFTLVKSF